MICHVGGSLFEPEERAKLVDIVSIQSHEIEALREEIRVYYHLKEDTYYHQLNH